MSRNLPPDGGDLADGSSPRGNRCPSTRGRRARHRFPLVAAALLWASLVPVSAQWMTQSFNLVPGWNAVYLHVDASHATLDALVGSDSTNPIGEIWLWRPAPSTAQFVTSPQLPTTATSQWVSWDRFAGATSDLQRMPGNAAYLVKVTGTANYTWNLKGKAVPPNYLWTSTGLNFIGFPTPAEFPPTFEAFLTPAPGFQQAAEFYMYGGGALGPGNPARLYGFRTRPLRRGEACWVRAGSAYNRYFGPVEVTLSEPAGIEFGDNLGQIRFQLRNLTASQVTVNWLTPISSSRFTERPIRTTWARAGPTRRATRVRTLCILLTSTLRIPSTGWMGIPCASSGPTARLLSSSSWPCAGAPIASTAPRTSANGHRCHSA